jgi:hypothetical protein
MCAEPAGSRRNHPVLAAGIKWFRRSILFIFLVIMCLMNQHAGAQTVGPANAILCNLSAPFTGSGAAAKLISGIASTHINICGFTITSSAADTVNISTGTGTNCGTNNASLTGTLNINSTQLVDHIPYAAISTPTGSDLCVNATTTTLTGIIWYSQF